MIIRRTLETLAIIPLYPVGQPIRAYRTYRLMRAHGGTAAQARKLALHVLTSDVRELASAARKAWVRLQHARRGMAVQDSRIAALARLDFSDAAIDAARPSRRAI